MSKHLEVRLALRPVLLAAALLLALAAMFALAATASAQTPDDGDTGGSSGGTSSESSDAGDSSGGSGDNGDGSNDDGDDDPAPPAASPDDAQPDCSNSLSLEALQDLYWARIPGSNTFDSDRSIAATPRSERLTDEQRQCALFMQSQRHPNLRWHFQTRCPVNEIFSHRVTGRTQTVQGILFEQYERVEDYSCTSVWRSITTDGNSPPFDLIPPAESVSIITVRYRVTRWRQAIVEGVPLTDSVTPPPSESHLAD